MHTKFEADEIIKRGSFTRQNIWRGQPNESSRNAGRGEKSTYQ